MNSKRNQIAMAALAVLLATAAIGTHAMTPLDDEMLASIKGGATVNGVCSYGTCGSSNPPSSGCTGENEGQLKFWCKTTGLSVSRCVPDDNVDTCDLDPDEYSVACGLTRTMQCRKGNWDDGEFVEIGGDLVPCGSGMAGDQCD